MNECQEDLRLDRMARGCWRFASARSLPKHWMSHFFQAAFHLELQRNESAKSLYTELAAAFPDSAYLTAQLATSFYNMRNFDSSQAAFERMRKRDPYRLTSLDTYSNILFVKELNRP